MTGPPPAVVTKSGAYNTVTIAPSLDLCLRESKAGLEREADDPSPAWEDAVRELIGYLEISALAAHVQGAQVGGPDDCDEVAGATRGQSGFLRASARAATGDGVRKRPVPGASPHLKATESTRGEPRKKER